LPNELLLPSPVPSVARWNAVVYAHRHRFALCHLLTI
jgi:hypothetical protein